MTENKYSERYMRLILMFDLPSETTDDRKKYIKFKRHFESLGYTMIQYSIYIKNTNSKLKIQGEIQKLKKFIPAEGKIRIMPITEFQYQQTIFLSGSKTTNERINSDERYIQI